MNVVPNHTLLHSLDISQNTSVLKILQPNDLYLKDGDVQVRIERTSDGFIFDANNSAPDQRVFKVSTACENPWISLMQNVNVARLEAEIPISRDVFPDGNYIVNYHDARFPDKVVISMDEIYVFNGKAETPRPLQDYQVAGRIMQIRIGQHTIPGSLGELLNGISTRIDNLLVRMENIETKIAQLSTNTNTTN